MFLFFKGAQHGFRHFYLPVPVFVIRVMLRDKPVASENFFHVRLFSVIVCKKPFDLKLDFGQNKILYSVEFLTLFCFFSIKDVNFNHNKLF